MQQLQPVADGPDWADQVVANSGPYQCIQFGAILQQSLPSESGPMDDLNAFLEPGMRVEHPDCPEWGIGQVQSNINGKITVNFPEAGKVVINGSRVILSPVFDD